jgi:accessory gene regulator protein AgrB
MMKKKMKSLSILSIFKLKKLLEIEAMVSTCAEFMKCFLILGYDFEGNTVKPIFYAKNDIDGDALNQYIQKFIMSNLH